MIRTIESSFGIFRQIFLEFILGAFLGILKVLQQANNIGLQKSKSFSSTNSHFFLLYFLKLVHSLANIHPTTCRTVLYDRIIGLFFWSYFVYRLSISLENFAGVSCSNTFGEDAGVSSNADIADWEQIVL